MPSDPIWWLAVVVQLLALPGSLLPVLPSLLWLPIGAGLWVWNVGWIAAIRRGALVGLAVVAGLLVSRVVPGQPGLLGIGGSFLLSWGWPALCDLLVRTAGDRPRLRCKRAQARQRTCRLALTQPRWH